MFKKEQALSEEEVQHIAWLARVKLSEEEKKLFTGQLNTIIGYFHIIDEVDTEGVKPTLHVLDLTNVSREDTVKASMSVEAALANAPNKEKEYFKAPKIV